MSEFKRTHTEDVIVAQAHGKRTVDLPYETPDGVTVVEFCGACGRMICHPHCPSDRMRPQPPQLRGH